MKHRLFYPVVALSCVVYVTLQGARFIRDFSGSTQNSEYFLQAALNQGDKPDESPPDSVLDKSVLHRISRVYNYQSEILKAEAVGDKSKVEKYLNKSVKEIETLLKEPGITTNAQFRELYRTVVTSYERFFGAPAGNLELPRGEIFELRDSLFAALNEVEDPLLEDVVLPTMIAVKSVIPMTMNRLVESSIAFLKRKPERHVNNWLSRSESYFGMIEQIMLEEKAPDELKYLALIESGLNPKAVSWAGAAGMWQFMPATGREFGLDADTWVDERMDPEKSTRAAARYLKSLHKMYDDWHLALAAYNCGPGNVNSAIRKLKKSSPKAAPTFWNIYKYLPNETRNYVPMYIAAAVVTSNPSSFGINNVKPGPPYEYDLLPVQAKSQLSQIAEASGATENSIKALNPELRRDQVPPSPSTYQVRVPIGSSTRLSTANSKILVADASPVRVRYGYRGYRPLEPTGNEPQVVAVSTSVSEPAPKIEPIPTETEKPPVQTASTGSSAPTGDYIIYRVRSGDTLTEIAVKYHVTADAIMQWNNLDSEEIYVGQRLRIYTDGSAPEPVLAENRTPTRRTSTRQTGTVDRPQTRTEYPQPAPRRTPRSERERVIEMGKEYGKVILRRKLEDVLGARLPAF